MIPRGLFAIRGRAPRVLNNVLGMVPPAPPALPVHNFIRQRFLVEQFAAQQRAAQLAAQQRAAELAAQQRAAELAAARRAAELERQRLAELERQRLAELERQRLAEIERQRLAELERQRLAEIERQRLAEIERQRLAEIERQRLAELERQRLAAEARAKRLAEIERQVETFKQELNKRLADIQKAGQTVDQRARELLEAAIRGLDFEVRIPLLLEAELIGGGTVAVEIRMGFPDCLQKNAHKIANSIADAFSPQNLMKSLGQSALSSAELDKNFKENSLAALQSTVEGFPETFVVAAVKGCNEKLGTLLEKISDWKTKYEIAQNMFKQADASSQATLDEYLKAHRLTDEEIQAIIKRQTLEEETKRRLEQEAELQRQQAELALKKAQEESEQAAKLKAEEIERQKAESEHQKAELERRKAALEEEKRIQQARLEEINAKIAEERQRREARQADWERNRAWANAANLQQRIDAIQAFIDWLNGLAAWFNERVFAPLLDFVRRSLGLG